MNRFCTLLLSLCALMVFTGCSQTEDGYLKVEKQLVARSWKNNSQPNYTLTFFRNHLIWAAPAGSSAESGYVFGRYSILEEVLSSAFISGLGNFDSPQELIREHLELHAIDKQQIRATDSQGHEISYTALERPLPDLTDDSSCDGALHGTWSFRATFVNKYTGESTTRDINLTFTKNGEAIFAAPGDDFYKVTNYTTANGRVTIDEFINSTNRVSYIYLAESNRLRLYSDLTATRVWTLTR